MNLTKKMKKITNEELKYFYENVLLESLRVPKSLSDSEIMNFLLRNKRQEMKFRGFSLIIFDRIEPRSNLSRYKHKIIYKIKFDNGSEEFIMISGIFDSLNTSSHLEVSFIDVIEEEGFIFKRKNNAHYF